MKKDKIGEVSFDIFGTKMVIIEYEDNNNIIIEFQDEYKTKVKCRYNHFKNGSVKNPYHPSAYGVGYLGIGKYSKKEYPDIYKHWYEMLRRCYDPYELNRHPTYINCYTEEYLHNFQNFAKWYEENYYEIPGEKMCLDKDILVKGNKIYDREHMIFVPQKINTLFIKCDKSRGDYPIGCNYNKGRDKIEVRCRRIPPYKRKHLGYYPLDKPFQAFTYYKKFKEDYIKEVADEYKEFIPTKLYDAMYFYQVEIND